jgi:hypothetical protein
MARNSASISMIIATAAVLSGAINQSLSETVADGIPQWAGGLPPDVPPRPTDSKYAEYEEKLLAKTVINAPKADDGSEIKSHSVY